jgi:predicted Zn finger-like uncharacterized protein
MPAVGPGMAGKLPLPGDCACEGERAGVRWARPCQVCGSAAMSILVSCPHCHDTYRVSNDLEGRAIRCRDCRRDFTARAAVPAKGTDVSGIVSLILGGLAVLCMLLGFFTNGISCFVALPLALIGVILGFVAKGALKVIGLTLNLIVLAPAAVFVGLAIVAYLLFSG